MGGGGHRVMLLIFGVLLVLGGSTALVLVAPMQRTREQPQPLSAVAVSVIDVYANEDAAAQRALKQSTAALHHVRTYVSARISALRNIPTRDRTLLGVTILATMVTPVVAVRQLLTHRRPSRRTLQAQRSARGADRASSAAPPPTQSWIQSDETDRRCAAAVHGVAEALRAGGYRSTIVAVSRPLTTATTTVELTLAVHPQDRSRLQELAGAITHAQPAWQVTCVAERLRIAIDAPAASVSDLPLMVPVLETEQRDGRWATSAVLAGVNHLGIFGANAHAVVHAMMTDLLCTWGPRRVHATVIGAPGIARVYAAAPHVVLAPDDTRAAVHALCRDGRTAAWLPSGPPILAILVEPDGELLDDVCQLVRTGSDRPHDGLHVLLVMQDRPRQLRAHHSLAALHIADVCAPPRDDAAPGAALDELRVAGLRVRGCAPRQAAEDAAQLMRLLPFT